MRLSLQILWRSSVGRRGKSVNPLFELSLDIVLKERFAEVQLHSFAPWLASGHIVNVPVIFGQ